MINSVKETSMNNPVKIFIVEDEMIIAANISLQLSQLGYEVTGIASRGEDVLSHVKENQPDIILMDIQLRGDKDGVETSRELQKIKPIPIIFLTANTDDANFNRAKEINPYAFISKPFKKLDLQRAIELTINHILTGNQDQTNEIPTSAMTSHILDDCVFVRHKDNMVKVWLKDIYYIEAQRNYCKVYAKDKEYLLVMTLKEAAEKLPGKSFMRVHRSYLINLSHINKLATTHVVVDGKAIPVSKTFREPLLERLQLL